MLNYFYCSLTQFTLHSHGDLPDASDAYEGDPDALWNTD